MDIDNIVAMTVVIEVGFVVADLMLRAGCCPINFFLSRLVGCRRDFILF